MTDRQIRILAKRIIEEKMGLLISGTDVILLETNGHEKWVTRILFYRRGFKDLQYEATYVDYKKSWNLTLLGMQEQTEINL